MDSHEVPGVEADYVWQWKIWNTSIVCTIAIIFLIIMRYLLRRKRYSQLMPGRCVRFFSILGNLSDIPLNAKTRNGFTINVFLLKLFEAYSRLLNNVPLFCFWFFCSPVVVLCKTEAIEAFVNDTKMLDKGWFYNWTHPVLGSGLLTSDAKKWKKRRKLLNPCVGMNVLKNFMPAMNENSRTLVKRWRKETHKDSTDIYLDLSLCAFDILCETMLGVKVGAQETGDYAFSKLIYCVHRGMELIIDRLWNIFLWSDFIYSLTRSGKEMKKIIETSENFTRTIIRETKAKYFKGEIKIGDGKRKSLMEVLLEHHLLTKELSEEDIREELITFTIAGHHSSATSLTWTLYLIGLHKAIQTKIQAELDWIFGDDQERPANNEDLKAMEYLESVIKESLRLFPPVYFFARHISEDIKICNYTIPKDTTCILSPYLVHRDDRVFSNPEKFDPDRFLPENSSKYNSNSYIPFAAGPRNCIGQAFALIEEKIILSTLLRNYCFESLEKRDQLPPTVDIVLKPSKPIQIKIRARTRNS